MQDTSLSFSKPGLNLNTVQKSRGSGGLCPRVRSHSAEHAKMTSFTFRKWSCEPEEDGSPAVTQYSPLCELVNDLPYTIKCKKGNTRDYGILYQCLEM